MRRLLVGMTLFGIACGGPSFAAANDQQIAQQIQERLVELKDQGELKGFALNLQVKNGVACLEGHVADADQEFKTLDVVRRIPGVVKVVDAIEIEAADELVQQAATQNDARDRHPAASLAARKNEASPSDTASVANYSALKRPRPSYDDPTYDSSPTPLSKSDDRIADAIYDRLKGLQSTGQLRGFGVDVKVNDGEVTLDGHVADNQQKALVTNAAQSASGVKRVRDRLAIAKPTSSRLAAPAETPIAAASTTEPTTTSPAAPAPIKVAGGTLVPVNAVPIQPVPQMIPQPVPHPMYAAQTPRAFAPATLVNQSSPAAAGTPVPMHTPTMGGYGVAPARFDHPSMPGYAWPSYAAYPNYGAVTYPKQYSAQAWPYIGPFYPYPQVPLGWRKVELQWDDGWWYLDFKSR